jgi:hypothetical protein
MLGSALGPHSEASCSVIRHSNEIECMDLSMLANCPFEPDGRRREFSTQLAGKSTNPPKSSWNAVLPVAPIEMAYSIAAPRVTAPADRVSTPESGLGNGLAAPT